MHTGPKIVQKKPNIDLKQSSAPYTIFHALFQVSSPELIKKQSSAPYTIYNVL